MKLKNKRKHTMRRDGTYEPSLVEKVRSMIGSNMTFPQVGKEIGVSRSVIANIVRVNEIPHRASGRYPGHTAFRESWPVSWEIFTGAAILYACGLSVQQCANEIGVKVGIIRRAFAEHGVKADGGKRLFVGGTQGSDNPMWKGDDAGYNALHNRVVKARGKPMVCSRCLTTSAQRYEWANISGNYRDVDDYIRLCKKCHHRMDMHGRMKLNGVRVSTMPTARQRIWGSGGVIEPRAKIIFGEGPVL